MRFERKVKILLIGALFCFAAGCGVLSEREKCYAKEYCDTAVEDCFLGTYFLFGTSLFSPSTGSPYYTSESEANDTFAASDYVTLSNYYSYATPVTYASGTISSGADVDLFYGYSYSGTTTVTMTKTGAAV